MEKIRIADVDPLMGPAAVKRKLTDPLDTNGLAIGYYELAPGESFAFGLHAHGAQEEVFYVQSGTATFETGDTPDDTEDVVVEAGEFVRFAPGEYQQGRNAGDERVIALAIGAPREAGDLDMRRDCPECGERTPNRIEMADDREALVTRCDRCDAETGRFD